MLYSSFSGMIASGMPPGYAHRFLYTGVYRNGVTSVSLSASGRMVYLLMNIRTVLVGHGCQWTVA